MPAPGKRRPRLLAALAIPFWLLCGLVGALLLYLWLGTEHWAGVISHTPTSRPPNSSMATAAVVGVPRSD